MKLHLRACARGLVATLAFVLCPTLVPGVAAETPLGPAPIAASLARLEHAQSPGPLRLQQTGSPARGGSFFRTRRGVAALVAATAITGIVVYSAKHGRVKSAIR